MNTVLFSYHSLLVEHLADDDINIVEVLLKEVKVDVIIAEAHVHESHHVGFHFWAQI